MTANIFQIFPPADDPFPRLFLHTGLASLSVIIILATYHLSYRLELIEKKQFVVKKPFKEIVKLQLLECPKCGGSVEIAENSRRANCRYCGSRILLLIERVEGRI